MLNWIAVIGFYIFYLGEVSARNVTARKNHDCAFLQAKIYCYGGASGYYNYPGTPIESLTDDIFIRLDVSGAYNVTELQNMWETPDGPTVGPNYYFAMVALPNFNSIFIDGGRGSRVGDIGSEKGMMTEQVASLYNASESGSWRTINTTGRNHVDSHVALTGRNNTIYIYGGKSVESTRGFFGMVDITLPDQLITYNLLRKPQWKYESGFLKQQSSEARIYHKGAFGSDQQTIYYIGGVYESNTLSIHNHWIDVDMKDILTYDTRNGSWGSVLAHGASPKSRIDHTVTLNPNTGELIIYGGGSLKSLSPLDDFMYTFNTHSLEYKSVIPVNSTDAPGAGPRYGHAAVLVDNSSLFILFGSDGSKLHTDFYVLDIDDGYIWKSYVPPELRKSDFASNPIPWQTTVGICVGLGVPLAAILIYCIIKRRHATFTRVNEESINSVEPTTQRGRAHGSDALERSPIDMQVADPPPPYSQHSMDAVANTEERNATSENIDVHEPLVIRLIRPTNVESR